MSDPLATYLQDHLAGSRVAIDLLESLRDQSAGEELGRFAAELLAQVNEDRAVLEELIDRIGGGGRGIIKESLAWLTEKGTRIKLRRRAGSGLGTLESLETVALGIQGKLALWRALKQVAPSDDRLYGLDFDHLAARALDQHALAEQRRLEAARSVLPAAPP